MSLSNVCVLTSIMLHLRGLNFTKASRLCAHQEGGPRDGEGLFVEVGAAEQQEDIVVVFSLVEL